MDEIVMDLVSKGRWEGEITHTRRDGKKIVVSSRWALQRGDNKTSTSILEINTDITQEKEAEERINATNALLSLFSEKHARKEYLDGVIDLIQSWSGCRCVGIRVLDERGYIPYESYVGFSQEFWENENWISVHKNQCACIRVVTRNPDPQDLPMVTPRGSFCCGNTCKLLAQLSEEERARFRGVCIQNGFLSVSIIPICHRERIFGAIHLADERGDRLSLKEIEFIESMAPLIGEAINRFNLEEKIRESENRLRILSSQLLTVQEDERKRIARDVHDSLGASLAAVKYGMEATLQQLGRGTPKTGKIVKSLKDTVSRIQESIEEVRRIQMDLRPPILDDLGIIPTINWFTREFQKIYSHINIEREVHLQESDVSPLLRTVIYRVMQEALNNIAKHSKAEVVHLALKKEGDRIELTIKDDGDGFDYGEVVATKSTEKGIGLSSMRERAELSGGAFTVDSSIGAGTTIRASWALS
jgi:signal transduction histidine kinase